MRPRLLDLFCGAGGAAMGYHRAGFEVVGVDVKPQPNYPFEFVEADALGWWLWKNDPALTVGKSFDAIHASPPCQAYTRAQSIRGYDHPKLIGPTRDLLEESGLPYIIENVVGSPLRDPVMLCGSGFGRPFCRHRLFEINWPLGSLVPPCAAGQLGVQPEHVLHTRKAGSVRGERRVRGIQIFGNNARADAARAAMEMPWASRDEVSEAIPPTFTEFIGAQLMAHIRAGAEAPVKPQREMSSSDAQS